MSISPDIGLVITSRNVHKESIVARWKQAHIYLELGIPKRIYIVIDFIARIEGK